jgi:tRNA threonylcarbamoyladenosine biosynthesis protein TsaB
VNNLLALADSSGKNKVISVIDARMGEIYFSAYIKEGKTFSEPMFEGVYKPDELPQLKESGWTLIGNAIETYKREMKDHFGQQIEDLIDGPYEVVKSISQLAIPFIKNKIFELIHAEPVYLRNKVAFTTEERKALNAI